MRVNIRTQVLVGPLTGRARVLARCEDVPSLQTYSDHSIDKNARLREQWIAGTRSLPAPGPARAWQPPCRRPILIATKAMLFMGQHTRRFVDDPLFPLLPPV